jgi:hypothetical protein
MALKDIAVFIDPTPEGDDWLRLAATIAKTHNAVLPASMWGAIGVRIIVTREGITPSSR